VTPAIGCSARSERCRPVRASASPAWEKRPRVDVRAEDEEEGTTSATTRKRTLPVAMIETVKLTKKYGDLVALNNLNLQIEAGECFGFIGPNGAGKTTTIKILATLLRPSWGEARIDGVSVGFATARQVRRVIGYVPDYFGHYQDMVVREYLEFFAAAYNIHGEQRDAAIADVLDLTDLAYKSDADVNGLSRGMQQRLSVARVLLHDPKVLLLDEPASGLDPRARIEMRELLKELHRMGKTILISSHILLELADLCSTIGIIERGEMKFIGTTDEIMARARVGTVLNVAVAARVEEAMELVGVMPGVVDVELHGSVFRVTIAPPEGVDSQSEAASATPPVDAPAIAERLVQAGFRLTRLEEEKVNLETAFMRLTQGLVQ